MDWVTLGTSIGAGITSGGPAALAVDLYKHRRQARRDKWQDFLATYDKH